MTVRKRSTKDGRYDVFVRIGQDRHRIATVENKEFAKAISDVAKACVRPAGQVASGAYLRALRMLNAESQELLSALDERFSINRADAHEKECWKDMHARVTASAMAKAYDDVWAEADREWKERVLALDAARVDVGQQLSKMRSILLAPPPPIRNGPYPDVPLPWINATDLAGNMPDEPGVYFVWFNSACHYVGQSSCLSNRVTLKHEKILPQDEIGFILFEEPELLFAEAYYIGSMRPHRNFGSRSAAVRQGAIS